MIKTKLLILPALIVSFAAVLVIWAISYLLGPDIARISSDIVYIPLTILLTVTAFFQVSQTFRKNKENLIWIIFAVFAISYCVAQHIWVSNDLIFGQITFPSFSDVAFLLDTICLIPFFILYVKSLKQSISKKILAISVLPSCGIVLLSTYIYQMVETTENIINQVLLFSYPFLDSIALVPALIGIILWFKNKLKFPILLICSSMIPLVIGDVLFQIATQSGTDYLANISDLFFYIQIDLLIFGVYYLSNIKNNNNFTEKKV